MERIEGCFQPQTVKKKNIYGNSFELYNILFATPYNLCGSENIINTYLRIIRESRFEKFTMEVGRVVFLCIFIIEIYCERPASARSANSQWRPQLCEHLNAKLSVINLQSALFNCLSLGANCLLQIDLCPHHFVSNYALYTICIRIFQLIFL